ncbi:hypothetical protein AB9T88_02090 [Flavobacterium sp. LBUM151]
MKIKFYQCLVLFFIFLGANAQKTNTIKIDSLFIEFKKQSFYQSVYPAKQELENYQKIIIPELISILSDPSFVKLTNTFDLIYPGTTSYYGHGHYVPYDMDWISVRAGWFLEEITFQDFGYLNSNINDEKLLKLAKENYKDYIKKGTYDLDWKNKTSEQKSIEYRKILSSNAEKWWKENKKKWSRISAIKEALESNNENRLSKVFQYLRFGETKCDNLTKDIYKNEIMPIILALNKTTKYPEIQEQIDLIITDSVNYKILN